MILKNGRVITQDKDRPYIEDGAVVIEGNKIIAVDTTENILAKYKEEDIIDVDGKVIMPGFINTHHHIYSAFVRGMASSGKPNENFLEILENLWWKIDKKLSLEDLKYSAYTTYIDCIKKGVTTVFDHNASPFAVTGSLDSIADAAKDLGLRTCLCYEVSDRDGEKIAQEGIEKLVVETVKNAGGNPCPPIIVGVGIGGNFEKAAILAKEAVLRDINDVTPDPIARNLETELLELINKTGVGPLGLGGLTTALAVKVNTYPCHIAALPVAININCHAARHKEVEL